MKISRELMTVYLYVLNNMHSDYATNYTCIGDVFRIKMEIYKSSLLEQYNAILDELIANHIAANPNSSGLYFVPSNREDYYFLIDRLLYDKRYDAY